MYNFIKTVAILAALTIGTATAQESGSALYLHPISLIVSTAIPDLPAIVSVTFEKQTSDQNALIINPGVMHWNLSDDYTVFSMNTIGSGIGLRHYLNADKGNHGLYLQAMGHVKYMMFSLEEEHYNSYSGTYETDSSDGNILGLSGLGYIGGKGQWDRICLFWDIGFGYQYQSGEAKSGSLTVSGTGVGLALDVNLGLGYAF